MKILFICSDFPRSYDKALISGIVKNAFNQAKAMAKRGYLVTVITDGELQDEWEIDGMKVCCVGSGVGKGVMRAAILDIKITYKIMQLGINNFDLLHIHTGNLLFFYLLKKIRILKIKTVYSAHGTTTPELSASYRKKRNLFEQLVRINGKIQEWIDRFMWKNSDHLVSSSEFQVNEMVAIYQIERSRVTAIKNGYDENLYYPDTVAGENIKKHLGIDLDAKVVLFVGRLTRKKGIHLIMDSVTFVLRSQPDAVFVFVLGDLEKKFDASYVTEVYEIFKTHPNKDRMYLCKNIPEAQLPSYYNMADVCVFPSIGYESLPTVVFEAMATGVPIITQGNWGTNEVLNEVLLNQQELIDGQLPIHIVEVLSDKVFREKLKEQYLKSSSTQKWSVIAKTYDDLYKSLIDHRLIE